MRSVVGAEGVAGRVHEVEAAVLALAEVLRDAQVGNDRGAVRVLQGARRAARRDVEREAERDDGVGRLVADERDLRAEHQVGEAVGGLDVGSGLFLGSIQLQPRRLTTMEMFCVRATLPRQGEGVVVAAVPDRVGTRRVLPDEDRADFGQRRGSSKKNGFVTGDEKTSKARSLCSTWRLGPGWNAPGTPPHDVGPAAFELVAEARPEAAEVGVAVDDPWLYGLSGSPAGTGENGGGPPPTPGNGGGCGGLWPRPRCRPAARQRPVPARAAARVGRARRPASVPALGGRPRRPLGIESGRPLRGPAQFRS